MGVVWVDIMNITFTRCCHGPVGNWLFAWPPVLLLATTPSKPNCKSKSLGPQWYTRQVDRIKGLSRTCILVRLCSVQPFLGLRFAACSFLENLWTRQKTGLCSSLLAVGTAQSRELFKKDRNELNLLVAVLVKTIQKHVACCLSVLAAPPWERLECTENR